MKKVIGTIIAAIIVAAIGIFVKTKLMSAVTPEGETSAPSEDK
jgi:hypothetical protein